MIKERPTKLKPQTRVVSRILDVMGERALVDKETRTVRLSFSSEEPVDMWYGTEILSHAKGAVRLSGIRQTSMPLLYNHNRDDLLGKVESIEIGADKRGYAVVRFGKDARGQWALDQSDDEILLNVSFMYRVYKFEEDLEAETFTATDWEPYEISLVTVPADATVGLGREAGDEERDVIIETRSQPQPATAEIQKEKAMFRKNHVVQDAAGDGTGGGAGAGGGGTVVVDAARERQTGAEAERLRMQEIEALCKKHKIDDSVRQGLIQKGATVEMARGTVLDILQSRNTQSAVDLGSDPNPDLSDKEKKSYSLLRAINAGYRNSWKDAGLELEVSNAISKKIGRVPGERGFFMPTNIQFAMRAKYAVGAPTTGGNLVGTELLAGSFIEILRNQARVMQLGATILSGLVGNVDIPRRSGTTTAYWVTEGNGPTESEGTFDKVSLSPKTIGTYSKVTRNMLMQATPDIDMLVRADMIAQIALGIDIASLSGSGSSGQPLGITNQSGIGSVIGGTNGLAITIDHLIDLETAVMNANAPEESLGYIANAKTVGALKKLKSTAGEYLWSGSAVGQRTGTPGEINGYPVARTNQARGNLTKGTSSGVCSEIFFGAWNELVIGEWGVLEVVPNPYGAGFAAGDLEIRALQSVDVGVRHGASFSVMSDALTA